ncbi:hypothetical protein QW131_15210 [Roseibium salinum]|nr:hypothetical protein [Roseibium salinum]
MFFAAEPLPWFLPLPPFWAAFFVWHKVDKSSAVRRAREGYVTQAELTSTRAQLEELRRRQAVADAARGYFNSEVQKAQAEAKAAEQELERYVSTVEDSCVVRSGLIDRLHNR